MSRRAMGTHLLADEIARELSLNIQMKEYKAGERLTVRKLCDEFGVSETPVKQALNQLMASGLAVATPKCGMRVRTFDACEMKDTLEARMMIEQFCAKDAVNRVRRDEAFAKQMGEILETSCLEYEKCIADYTQENFNHTHEHDRQIHSSIVECCKNNEIIHMYNSLNSHSGMFTRYENHTPETLKKVIEEHRMIIEELLNCDVDGLKNAIARHIESTIQVFSE